MDSGTLGLTITGERVAAGRAILRALVAEGIGVAAACWAKQTGWEWWIIVVSPTAAEIGQGEAYLKARAALERSGISRATGRPLFLCGPSQPMGQDVMDVKAGRRSFYTGSLGGHEVEEIWMYPDDPNGA